MVKPTIRDMDIVTIRTEIVAQSPKTVRLWITYGAGLCAALIGLSESIKLLPPPMHLAFLVVVAVSHWRARDQFGLVPALDKLDFFDLTPSNEIRKIENDPDCKAWGINVCKEDWPHLFKIGIRVSALRQIETFESLALSIVGYGAAVLIPLFS